MVVGNLINYVPKFKINEIPIKFRIVVPTAANKYKLLIEFYYILVIELTIII